METIIQDILMSLVNNILDFCIAILKNAENFNFSQPRIFLNLVTILCFLFIFFKFIFEKNKSIIEYKRPIILLLINYFSINLYFAMVQKTHIYDYIYKFKEDLNNDNCLINLLFLIILLIIIKDQIDNILQIFIKPLEFIFSVNDTSKMNLNIKKNILEIIKEILCILSLYVAFNNNLNIIFIILVVLQVKNINKYLYPIFNINDEKVILQN